jgi:hypothetical protein
MKQYILQFFMCTLFFTSTHISGGIDETITLIVFTQKDREKYWLIKQLLLQNEDPAKIINKLLFSQLKHTFILPISSTFNETIISFNFPLDGYINYEHSPQYLTRFKTEIGLYHYPYPDFKDKHLCRIDIQLYKEIYQTVLTKNLQILKDKIGKDDQLETYRETCLQHMFREIRNISCPQHMFYDKYTLENEIVPNYSYDRMWNRNDATALLSSSLIVNADISPATIIVDPKLATINYDLHPISFTRDSDSEKTKPFDLITDRESS